MLAVIVHGGWAGLDTWAVWLQLAAMLALLGLSSSVGRRGKVLVLVAVLVLGASLGLAVVEAIVLPCIPQPCPWWAGERCCP